MTLKNPKTLEKKPDGSLSSPTGLFRKYKHNRILNVFAFDMDDEESNFSTLTDAPQKSNDFLLFIYFLNFI